MECDWIRATFDQFVPGTRVKITPFAWTSNQMEYRRYLGDREGIVVRWEDYDRPPHNSSMAYCILVRLDQPIEGIIHNVFGDKVTLDWRIADLLIQVTPPPFFARRQGKLV